MKSIEANEPLFYAGDNGDRFYIVLTGEMAICVPRTQEEILNLSSTPYDKVSIEVIFQREHDPKQEKFFSKWETDDHPCFDMGIARYIVKGKIQQHGTFGEIALSYTNRRTATIVSTKKSYLLSLTSRNFNDICDKASDLTAIFLRFLKQSFPGLTNAGLANLLCLLKEKKVKYGRKLTEIGKVPTHCYIIKSGFVQVSSIANPRLTDCSSKTTKDQRERMESLE